MRLQKNVITGSTFSISFPGEIKLGNRGAWGSFMSANAIGFRDSNANGATDSASTTFTGEEGKEVNVIVAADNADAGTTCTINGQTVKVGRLGEGEEETTKITLKADNTCDIKIVNKYEPPEEGGDDFNVNPMGIAILFDYGKPGAASGNGFCGGVDGCVPTGTVMGGGDFKDTMELVGSDGHKVTYTRINLLEETPIGSSIPGLHPGIVYEYTLKSDCGVSNDGNVNGDCGIDHRISMGGRRMEMEDMMLEGNPNYTDLILTLDEGVGTFTKSSATTGTLTMADTCAGDEGEGEADPNITCTTSTILTTGYTNPTFFTHTFDPGIIRSVKVINPHDPNGRFLRITIDPHVCDVDTIIETFCLCTSYDAFGDTIVEFGEMTVTKVDDYTIDVVITGQIIETQGYEG